MTVTPATFRQSLPEFASTTVYPDSAITYWVSVASLMVSSEVFGDAYDTVVTNLVAHNLTLEAKAQQEATAGGGTVTGGSGLIASKTVGSVSISYDNASGNTSTAGKPDAFYNQTLYGRRYLQMRNLFSKVGYQL